MSEIRKNRVLGKQGFFLGLIKVYSSQILCFNSYQTKKTKTVSKDIKHDSQHSDALQTRRLGYLFLKFFSG